jgi:hypothetical protein
MPLTHPKRPPPRSLLRTEDAPEAAYASSAASMS